MTFLFKVFHQPVGGTLGVQKLLNSKPDNNSQGGKGYMSQSIISAGHETLGTIDFELLISQYGTKSSAQRSTPFIIEQIARWRVESVSL